MGVLSTLRMQKHFEKCRIRHNEELEDHTTNQTNFVLARFTSGIKRTCSELHVSCGKCIQLSCIYLYLPVKLLDGI